MAFNTAEKIWDLTDIVEKTNLAADQKEYEVYYDLFFEKLDELNLFLSDKRFLGGDEISYSDLKFFDILVKWDVVYFFTYKLNRNRLKDFEYLWRYARDIYQNKNGRNLADFNKIKTEYYGNLDDVLNPYHIIPIGPDTSEWNQKI